MITHTPSCQQKKLPIYWPESASRAIRHVQGRAICQTAHQLERGVSLLYILKGWWQIRNAAVLFGLSWRLSVFLIRFFLHPYTQAFRSSEMKAFILLSHSKPPSLRICSKKYLFKESDFGQASISPAQVVSSQSRSQYPIFWLVLGADASL